MKTLQLTDAEAELLKYVAPATQNQDLVQESEEDGDLSPASIEVWEEILNKIARL